MDATKNKLWAMKFQQRLWEAPATSEKSWFDYIGTCAQRPARALGKSMPLRKRKPGARKLPKDVIKMGGLLHRQGHRRNPPPPRE